MNEVETVLRDCGVEYTDRGGELWARCPQHKERTGKEDRNPSWSINRITGAFHCFSCGYAGNLYILLRDLKGEDAAYTFRSEIEQFGATSNVDIASVRRAVSWVDSRKRARRQVQGIPQVHLALFDPEIPKEHLDRREITAEAASRYGVLWDARTASWILPFWHPDGYLLGWQRKDAVGRGFMNVPRAMPKSTTLFGWPVVEDANVVAVVESPLDAVKMYGLGYPTLALAGSKASREQVALLEQFDRTVILLDNDEAGRAGANSLFAQMRGHAIRVFRPESFQYKDPGETPDVILDSLIARYFV